MSRYSLKIVGASGQGLLSIGEIIAKALKRTGYCIFGYREYPSLIKGGHSSYQLDLSPREIRSTEQSVHLLVCLNHHGLEHNIREVKPGGIIVHDTPSWEFSPQDKAFIAERGIRVVYLPVDDMLQTLKAKPILGNVLFAAFIWAAFAGKQELLKELVGARFAHKKDLLDLNMRCIDEGYAYHAAHANAAIIALPEPNATWKEYLLLTGSQAMGLGVVHAGVRVYAGYPMTPSSPLLSYIADIQNETGMVVKQAEDEITAAQFVSGAMHMGARALTATSGGGFDLMSETVSLNGIIENPSVFVLAQRPGPATGLPTWTGQGDLFLAVHAAHGEFSRCVLSVSDSQDAFDLLPVAFNLAEKYQIPVIVLTDKQIAEAIYTQAPYDQTKAAVDRGALVTDGEALAKLRSVDRYDVHAQDGVSPRWLPGAKAATWNAQGDEHGGDGSIDESGENARLQMEKRMKKMTALEGALPEPQLFVASRQENGECTVTEQSDDAVDILLVGWGSTKGTVLDVLETLASDSGRKRKKTVGYLHYTYLWPLKIERFLRIIKKAKKVILIEGNFQGQLGMLLAQAGGGKIEQTILQYDGRPFFYDDLLARIRSVIP